jgi:hypothetical protein
MKRGVVVESNDDFVTLLTPDGQFIKRKNREGKYELGEEISFIASIENREEAATRTITKRRSFTNYLNLRVGALSAVAIMFIMFTFLPFFNNDKVYAYMSIDINPSFEIGINEELKVISLEPLNEEAERLIVKLSDWENKPFDDIVDAIVKQSQTNGYIYPGKEIVITTVIDEEEQEVQTKLEKDIVEIRSSYENEDMIVKTIESNVETREKALNQGISTGKYLQLQDKAKAADEQQKEEVTKPAEKEEQTEKSPTSTNQTTQAPIPANVNLQSVQETDTKAKLQETKKKLQENAQNLNNNKTKQQSNQQTKKIKEDKKQNNRINKDQSDRDDDDRVSKYDGYNDQSKNDRDDWNDDEDRKEENWDDNREGNKWNDDRDKDDMDRDRDVD